MKCRFSVFSIVLAGWMSFAGAADSGADERFLAARLGNRVRLEQLAADLKGYELESYVDYWRLQPDLATLDAATVRGFLARYDKTYIADRLRGEWLKQLGKQKQWSDFDVEYPLLTQPDQELSCYALQSRRAHGDASMLDDAMPLWLNLIEPPESCYPVLEALILEKRVLADAVWARIHRQFEANRTPAARYSMNYLPASQTPDARVALAVVDTPLPWLVKQPGNLGASRMNRELAALAISRIARNDPRMAAERLSLLDSQLKAGEKGWAWSQIGWQAAQRHMADALEWYRKAGDTALSDEVAQWKVRAALRAQDWVTVRAAIEAMPPALADQPAWIYWLGRAYRAGGRLENANALFARIAGQPNFYGNLADEELGSTIAVPPKAAAPTRDELDRVAAMPSVQRSLALFRLNLRTDGVREWAWAMRGMSDRDLLAASEIASWTVSGGAS